MLDKSIKTIISIEWSKEDNAYLASLEGYDYVKTHGQTPSQALYEMSKVIKVLELDL